VRVRISLPAPRRRKKLAKSYGNRLIGIWLCLRKEGGCGKEFFSRQLQLREAKEPFECECGNKLVYDVEKVYLP
jgi:hypothetical protein